MAIKHIISPGIGFSPGSVKFIVMRGLKSGEVVTASGMAEMAFTSDQPEMTFTSKQPEMTFTSEQPKITFTS